MATTLREVTLRVADASPEQLANYLCVDAALTGQLLPECPLRDYIMDLRRAAKLTKPNVTIGDAEYAYIPGCGYVLCRRGVWTFIKFEDGAITHVLRDRVPSGLVKFATGSLQIGEFTADLHFDFERDDTYYHVVETRSVQGNYTVKSYASDQKIERRHTSRGNMSQCQYYDNAGVMHQTSETFRLHPMLSYERYSADGKTETNCTLHIGNTSCGIPLGKTYNHEFVIRGDIYRIVRTERIYGRPRVDVTSTYEFRLIPGEHEDFNCAEHVNTWTFSREVP